MSLHGLQRHLLAYLAFFYALSDQSVAGVDSVYIVGILAVALLVWNVSSEAYNGYRTSSATETDPSS